MNLLGVFIVAMEMGFLKAGKAPDPSSSSHPPPSCPPLLWNDI